mmetsp:Transcript_44838/g.54265  ORF Transcript_44838/g.54265 Transcript_44838/m.54265 type:complete len:119 (+) Transcript_44838:171-527(+)
MGRYFRVTKDITTRLIKYVKKVDIKYNPLDGRTSSARALFLQLEASRFKTSNPKLKMNHVVASVPDPPSVSFQFADESKLDFDSQDYDVNEILTEVWMRATQIEVDFELSNRNIDDEL